MPSEPDNRAAPASETSLGPTLAWTGNDTPVAVAFDDPYYAREDGRAEANAVFLEGNGLPDRWVGAGQFTIAELGFGTGLNFVETWRVWRETAAPEQSMRFISFERWPLTANETSRALSRWPELAGVAAALTAQLERLDRQPGHHTLDFAGVSLELIVGDARDTLPQWQGTVDAWYLDGFSPAANPELWDAALLAGVFERTTPGGTFSTYTAAGWVRRNLIAAGFTVEKVAGHGRKRERLQGRRDP